jgi:hypothetical protein
MTKIEVGRDVLMQSTALPVEHEEFRAALCERVNNRTGTKEWCLRFSHPSAPVDHSRVLWLEVPQGHSWFVDPTDHRWFAASIELRRNSAVKFGRMKDAIGFLERLRPAEITDDEAPGHVA